MSPRLPSLFRGLPVREAAFLMGEVDDSPCLPAVPRFRCCRCLASAAAAAASSAAASSSAAGIAFHLGFSET